MLSWLEGDGTQVTMIQDVNSEPLKSPGLHNVKSQYQMQVLLVKEDDRERALELVEDFLSD